MLSPREVANLGKRPGTIAAVGILGSNLMIVSSVFFISEEMIFSPLYILFLILLASRFRALNNIVHECSHYAFHGSKAVNDFIGNLISCFLLVDYASYKREHASHHKFLGDYERDLDFQNIRSFAPHEGVRLSGVVRNVLSVKFLKAYVPRPRFDNPKMFVSSALMIGAGLELMWKRAWPQLFLGLPSYFLVYPLLKHLTDLVDHGGIYLNSEPLKQSRNFILHSSIMRSLLFPRNDCYHLVHHLYPFLPIRHFPMIHSRLMAFPAYRALNHEAHLPFGTGPRGKGHWPLKGY